MKRLTPEVATAAVPARQGNSQLVAIETGIASLTELTSSFAPGNDTSAAMLAVTFSMLDAMNELSDHHGEDPALIARRQHITHLGMAYGKQVFQIAIYARQLASSEEGFKTLRKKLLRSVEQLRLSAQRFGEFVDSRTNMRSDLGRIKTYLEEILLLDPTVASVVNTLTSICDAMVRNLDASLEPLVQQGATLPPANTVKERLYRALEALQTSLMCLGTSSVDGLVLRRPILAKLTPLMNETAWPYGPLHEPARFASRVREIVSDVENLRSLPETVTGHPFAEINKTLPLILRQAASIIALAEGSPQPAQRTLIPVNSPRQVSGSLITTWG